MPNHPRALVLGMRSTEWIRENADEFCDWAVVGWMPVVEGAEAIERVKRDHGSENVMEMGECSD